jgi:hypothetical protein
MSPKVTRHLQPGYSPNHLSPPSVRPPGCPPQLGGKGFPIMSNLKSVNLGYEKSSPL